MNPFWTNLISSLLGTLAGASVTIATIYFKDKLDKKHKVSEWFETYYLEEGFGNLAEFLSNWSIHMREDKYANGIGTYPLPTQSIARFNGLVKHNIILKWFSHIQIGFVQLGNRVLRDKPNMQGQLHILLVESVENMIFKMWEIRDKLSISAETFKSKGDAFSVYKEEFMTEFREFIISEINRINQFQSDNGLVGTKQSERQED